MATAWGGVCKKDCQTSYITDINHKNPQRMACFRILQYSHIIYSCNLIWVFTVLFIICVKSGKVFAQYITDTLTTSREDSTLYCIHSEKKIINHKLVENEGDFLVQLSFPCTLFKWRNIGHSDDVSYDIIINNVIVLTHLQSTIALVCL